MRIPAAIFFIAAVLLCAYNVTVCPPHGWRPYFPVEPNHPVAPPECVCNETENTSAPPCAPPIPAESAAARLYSPEGYDPGHLALMPDHRLSPLTKWIQGFIHRHQHPATCDRVLISDGHLSGFGSEMHVIGAHLAYAIQHNYVLVLSPNTCAHFRAPRACADGCACMLRPISNCSVNDDPATPRIQGEQRMQDQLADAFVAALQAEFPSMTMPQIKYWWRGQSAAYLMRFNDKTLRVLRALRHNQTLHYATRALRHNRTEHYATPFPLPANTIAVHIRGGDKHIEMPLVPAQTYAAAVFQLVDLMPHAFSRTVFVSGDDPQSIDEARRLIEARHMAFIYTRMPRLAGGHRMSDWRAAPDESEGSFYAHLLQLLMALEADAWVGTRGSNWNRLIDELRCVWVDKCQGVYVEVGLMPEAYSW